MAQCRLCKQCGYLQTRRGEHRSSTSATDNGKAHTLKQSNIKVLSHKATADILIRRATARHLPPLGEGQRRRFVCTTPSPPLCKGRWRVQLGCGEFSSAVASSARLWRDGETEGLLSLCSREPVGRCLGAAAIRDLLKIITQTIKFAQTRRDWPPGQSAWHNTFFTNLAATRQPVGATSGRPRPRFHFACSQL